MKYQYIYWQGLPSKFSQCINQCAFRTRKYASVSSNDAIPVASTSSRLLVNWGIDNDLSRDNAVPIACTSGSFFIDGGFDSDILAFGEKEDGGEGIHLFLKLEGDGLKDELQVRLGIQRNFKCQLEFGAENQRKRVAFVPCRRHLVITMAYCLVPPEPWQGCPRQASDQSGSGNITIDLRVCDKNKTKRQCALMKPPLLQVRKRIIWDTHSKNTFMKSILHVVGVALDGLLGVRKTTGTCMCVLDNPNISVVPWYSRTIRRLLIVYVTKACRCHGEKPSREAFLHLHEYT